MASVEDLCSALRKAALKVEIESSDPISILGGEDIRDVNGIKVYKRGFSIKFTGNKWLVKLPEGQIVEDHELDNSDEVIGLVIKHYQSLRE
jgi:hypothetical protein